MKCGDVAALGSSTGTLLRAGMCCQAGQARGGEGRGGEGMLHGDEPHDLDGLKEGGCSLHVTMQTSTHIRLPCM